MSLISVIVPVYKVEPYLHQCVDSILNQTFKDFELILVDDGSPDNCPAICDEYAKKDSRVIVIHKENGGLSSARNAGLDYVFANSNSEYISFVDSDDYVDVLFLSEMYQAVDYVDMAVCPFFVADNGNIIVPQSFDSVECDGDGYWDIPCYGRVGSVAWNKLYKKTLFKDVRYPVPKLHEDEYVLHRILNSCKKIHIINRPLYYYRKRSDSIMSTLSVDSYKDQLIIFDIYIERSLFYYEANKYLLFNYFFSKALDILFCLNKNDKKNTVIKSCIKRAKKIYISKRKFIRISKRYVLMLFLSNPFGI